LNPPPLLAFAHPSPIPPRPGHFPPQGFIQGVTPLLYNKLAGRAAELAEVLAEQQVRRRLGGMG
jgi:hypothetical protein